VSTADSFGEASPQRTRLAAALRELRRAADLSGEALGRRIGASQSKVSRIELGQLVPSTYDVERWGKATRASAGQQAELLELVEAVTTEAVAWRRQLRRGLVALQRETAQLEASAGTIREFRPLLIPGLLQTPAYARAVYEAMHTAGRPDITEAVAARMNRQAILYSEDKRFEFVLTEAGLRWRLGPPELMLAQLDRVGTAATLPNVSLGIVPLGAEVPVWHSHGFVAFDDRRGGPVVHVETLTSAVNVRSPDDVGRYLEAFARLQAAAVMGAEARALLEQLALDVRQADS
jgi:transcriptional regulator with XRE-family HTH domain